MNSNAAPPQRFSLFKWLLLFLIAALLVGAAARSFRKSEQRIATMEAPIAVVPDFSFTTQEGKILTKKDLLGKIWVADFIFTRCAGPCPMMTSHMSEIAAKVAPLSNVKLISVSVDPTYDTPSVLAEYAAHVHANPGQWMFLTGPVNEVASFTQQGMKQSLVFEPGGTPNHSTRLMIVDANGMIRSYHDVNDPEAVQKVLTDIGNLLRESQHRPSPSSPQ